MKIVLRVAKEAKKYWVLLLVAAVATLLLTGANLLAPKLMSQMTNLVASGLTDDGLDQVLWLAGLLLGVYLSRILFRYLSNYLSHKAAWNLVEELRMKVYGKLQSQSIDYYRNHQSGDLVSRTINDTATFEQIWAHLMPESITNVLTAVGVAVILLFINWKLALLTCIPIPFILISGWIFSTKVRPFFRLRTRVLGQLNAQLQDNFQGIQEIQTFNQQEPAAGKVEERARGFTVAMLKALHLSSFFQPSVEFLTATGMVMVVGFGGYLAYLEQINVGDIVAFMLYLSLFYAPITSLAHLLESLQEALAGAERVIEVLDAPEAIHDRPAARPWQQAKGQISFEKVSFSYQEEAPVLRDVSFTVHPGEMLALVGPTGVGKSTLVQLIARFYDPVEGSVLLDGKDARDLTLESIHQHVAMVLQDTFLFNGTIAENIAFARPHIGMEEMREAAQIARIHEDILAFPDGYETLVGERGAKLSGGQKQRIAIARAVICKAPILILDEATASVDVQTERYIQEAIQELSGTRTIVAIAHRLSTVRRADQILVLEEGRVVQRGTHDALFQEEGLYRDMCLVQEKGAQLA